VASDCLLGGGASGQVIHFGVNQIFHGEPFLYQDELIRCPSDHIDQVCSHGGVDMSDGDMADSITRVSVVKCMWVPGVMPCLVRY
jgi:hypothetical protein